MSDQWIFPEKRLAFGLFLATEVMRVVVYPVARASIDGLSGPAPQELIQLQPLQDCRDLADQVRDSERQDPRLEQEVARNAPPESPDEARRPPGEESPLEKLNEVLEDIEHVFEELTKTEEQNPRETAELLAARQKELEALLAGQEKERNDQANQMAGYRTQLELKYADSPGEQERHLGSFDKAAEASMAARHGSQLRQFEAGWQQKFQQKEAQPLIMPTAPGRDQR